MNPKIYAGIKILGLSSITELPRNAKNEFHFVIKLNEDLLKICQWAKEQDYYLCTLVATDERFQEEQVYKLYYILAALNNDELVILEYSLSDPQRPTNYQSTRNIFPSVLPLEKEIHDLFGLSPSDDSLEQTWGVVLHENYTAKSYPLRRDRTMEKIIQILESKEQEQIVIPSTELPEGMLIIPVGPIHAGIIEPGHFPFHVAGEVIEELPLQLGYKHRGIEKLFETNYSLENGWELAEKVSGDSSFAHSLAYCQAVEALAEVNIPDVVQIWRSLFLELERLYNHISDVGMLTHDMAYDRVSSQIACLREIAVQFNQTLTGHRLLRNINRPGGINISSSIDIENIRQIINDLTLHFLELSNQVLNKSSCRDRMISIGVLTKEEAKVATGIVRRASGWHEYDFRIQHPIGIYKDSKIQEILKATVTPEKEEYPDRKAPIFPYHLKGDVFARMAIRVAEVETSTQIINYLLERLKTFDFLQSTEPSIAESLRKTANLEFGLGYVEGWRGDILYFIMKGPENTIFRCKVRDPSLINWHVFPQAVCRKQREDNVPKSKDNAPQYWENILADFPLINKSFNLSYAGHDL